ncbi:MAG TPA: hypothetical protein VIJ76_02265 [Galbitalea sp.]
MSDSGLRAHGIVLLWLFGLQFVAGMVLNLFVKLTTHHPGTVSGDYFSRSWASLVWALSGGGGWTLVVHAGIAVILFLGALALFLRSFGRRGRGWRWASGLVAFFTLGALFNGLSFLDFNEDFSSMIMASCWLVAVSLVTFALVRSRKQVATMHL